MIKKRKAIALISGGLDSALATRIVLDQGIDILGLHLSSPFGCHEDVEKVASSLGIPLKVMEKGSAYLDLVRNPKYGYGKNMNPCIDCRIYMFQLAHSVMEEAGADFIVTGEVLGQRPMSQRREAMDIIDRDSQMENLILRPLSAQNMAPTKPEREGWVDREKLLAISGRGRTEQLAMAEALQLTGYSAPAGGCLLTDSIFSEKLASFFKTRKNPTLVEASLLRYGRYFDLNEETFVILGRNKDENEKLEALSSNAVREGHLAFFRPNFPGPVAVLSGTLSPVFFNDVAKRMLSYTKKTLSGEPSITVSVGEVLTELRFPHAASLELPVVHS